MPENLSVIGVTIFYLAALLHSKRALINATVQKKNVFQRSINSLTFTIKIGLSVRFLICAKNSKYIMKIDNTVHTDPDEDERVSKALDAIH